MRLLHTSDWHLGRSFHGNSTLPQLREVLGTLPEIIREHRIDAVLVAGDVFDHAAPAAELYGVLARAIRGIREAGAVVIITSGNHDNAARLGFQSEWAGLGGVHVATRGDAFREPITLSDSYGAVDVFAIPYLEPMLQTGLYPGEKLRSHHALLGRVMEEVRALAAARGNRSVVMSHCFAVNSGAAEVSAEAVAEAGEGLVWDLTAGGVDVVPTTVFDGIDYAALGHIHGRSELTPSIRYSGAPVHFSFSEAAKPRGGWIVELGSEGLSEATWVDFPVPRPLARLRGTLEELLTETEFAEHEASWVEATLTDNVRPIDAMRRLRQRFPHCAHIEFAPAERQAVRAATYTERVARKTDLEIVDEFLDLVRGGEQLDAPERELLREVIAKVSAAGNVGESA
ncbi:exonuclease SbcCD subunit D [Leucobacter sp. BZR 635]